jgi:serine/threonine-protein kinase
MEGPTPDSLNDTSLRELVDFDETLRLGQNPPLAPPLDPELEATRRFLVRLQSIWPRTPQKRIGAYSVTRNLGQGTLGTTYLVEDPATLRAYVLKIVWPNVCDDALARAQLFQEAKTLETLRHAGIASLKEARQTGPVCCIVSDYCAGQSLAQWRRHSPQPLTWDVAVPLLIKLSDILDAAHRQGITHGNLKPSNIFLTHDEEITPSNVHQASVCIGDFALAKVVQQSKLGSRGGLPWPMPQYLAPEQLRHRRRAPSPASDLYALGVLAYELLTGRCPVKGATRDEIAAQTRDAAPPSPRQYRPELPRELEALVLQCLQKNARERPASTKHLADALRALLPIAEAQAQPAWWKQWLGWM